MTILVRKRSIITETGDKIRLKYCLTRAKGRWGLLIRADRNGRRETAACEHICDRFREGRRLLRQLQKGCVTPVSLPDILADRRKKGDVGKNLDKDAII